MNRILSAVVLTCIATAASLATAGNRVGDFALIDSQGDFHRMGYYDNYKAIALLAHGNDAKNAAASVAALQEAQAKYKDSVMFFLIDSATDTRERVQARMKELDTDIRVLMDDTQLISRVLGAERLGEAFLLDPKTFDVLYRGPAGDPLRSAITAVLAGQAVAKPKVAVKGDKIIYRKDLMAKTAVSYSKDIAPILADNCARCHREGGIGPFAMNNHAVVQGFAPMIREVVMTKRMPPGQIDPYVGHFKTTYALTPLQTQQLISWINAGAKKDGATDPLTELKWPESKWTLGQPDLVIKIPPQNIPATGVLPLKDVVLPIEGLDRDRYVRASEYLAGDRTVLHHTVTGVIPPEAAGTASSAAFAYNLDGARITAYIPGTRPLVEPPNTGGILKKGSSLSLNLHYTTTGKATTDAGEIGVWFYPDDQIPTERMSIECGCILNVGWKPIPPFASNHEMKRTVTLPKAAYLYGITPHMHFRGKRMRFHAEYPDGRREELLNVANYQYNWQMNYELAEPKLLPAGTKIVVNAWYDNSAQNKANPDPSRRVPAGEQSWDEMMVSAITLKYIDKADARQSQR